MNRTPAIMVADTSAFLAILLQEEDAIRYKQALLNAERVLLSSATALETFIVVTHRLGAEGVLRLHQLLSLPLFEISSVTPEQLQAAQSGYMRYGKGRAPAALNFGDLFAYALSKHTNLPLLFKGADFAQTDLTPALPAPQ